jgi:hypothetical protein
MNAALAYELKDIKKSFAQTIRCAKIYAEFLLKNGESFNPVIAEFPLTSADWVDYPHYNVCGILCNLNSTNSDITIINVKFEKNGFIPPLSHDRLKTIYVIHGEVEDAVNNRTFKQGDVYRIEPNIVHSLKSDYCLLTITWEPAYPS